MESTASHWNESGRFSTVKSACAVSKASRAGRVPSVTVPIPCQAVSLLPSQADVQFADIGSSYIENTIRDSRQSAAYWLVTGKSLINSGSLAWRETMPIAHRAQDQYWQTYDSLMSALCSCKYIFTASIIWSFMVISRSIARIFKSRCSSVGKTTVTRFNGISFKRMKQYNELPKWIQFYIFTGSELGSHNYIFTEASKTTQ